MSFCLSVCLFFYLLAFLYIIYMDGWMDVLYLLSLKRKRCNYNTMMFIMDNTLYAHITTIPLEL